MKWNQLFDGALQIRDGNVLLRRARDTDMDKMLEMYGDVSIYKYRPGMPRKTEMLIRKLMNKQGQEMEAKTAAYLVICDADDEDTMVGMVEVYNPEPRIEKVEIGYTIMPSMQRKGYGRAAVKAITEYLFDVCEVNRVTAIVHVDNIGSRQVLIQNRFIQEGIEREGAFWQGIGYVDVCRFAKLKKDNIGEK